LTSPLVRRKKQKNLFVVIDAEFNGLNPDKVWVIVCREVDSGTVKVFDIHNGFDSFLRYSKSVSCWIGHNIIAFDLPAIQRILTEFHWNPRLVIDTLVVSRLLNYPIEGGHSLEAWGRRLGEEKIGLDITDWSCYTEDIRDRCLQDTLVNLKLYQYLSKYIYNPIFKDSLRVEHNSAYLCSILRSNGFPYDRDAAIELKNELENRISEIDKILISSFPSSVVLQKEFTPRLTKSGSIALKDFRWLPGEIKDLSWVKPNEEYSLVSLVPYNPGSLKETIDRLWEAGWKPTEKTKGYTDYLKSRDGNSEKKARFERYGWKLSEENLRTLPETAPEGAQRLVERLILASRVSDIEEHLQAAVKAPEGYYTIHGNFNHIGSWTQRKSHDHPNMANIPTPKPKDKPSELDLMVDEIDHKLRSFFITTPGKKRRLIGVDADGIQMRIFAHYVNDLKLTTALVSGSKKDATDIHSVHQRALGTSCKTRDDAKTFIYAWLLGAGIAKVSEILHCSISDAKQAVEQFIEFYPGLKSLKQSRIPRDVKVGYFEGLDKRLVVCNNEHKMLAGYLQNGESVVMKHAAAEWYQELIDQKLPFWFRNDVHDEWQVETEDDDGIARRVSDILADSIVHTGERLKLNCPLAATVSTRKDGFIGGYNWSDTH